MRHCRSPLVTPLAVTVVVVPNEADFGQLSTRNFPGSPTMLRSAIAVRSARKVVTSGEPAG